MSASSSRNPKESNHDFAHQFKDRNLKVALVCDWLTVVGGAEQVLREIHHSTSHAMIWLFLSPVVMLNLLRPAQVLISVTVMFPHSITGVKVKNIKKIQASVR